MVKYTPTQSIPYPETGDDMKIASRDMEQLALAADAAVLASFARTENARIALSAAITAARSESLGAVATTRTELGQRINTVAADVASRLDGIASAYDVAVAEDDFAGTVTEWLDSLVGPRGPEGPAGGTSVTDPQVAAWIGNNGTQTGAALDARFRRSVSVTEYGATGDGVSEDHQAVQAAMDALGAMGGGTLYFPPGVYYFRSLVDLVSDVQLLGYGATIVKRFASDSPYAAFRGKAGTALGYGAGVNNVTVEGLTFSGNYAEERSICAFTLHRAANITITNCRFIEASGAGHVIDLGGCTDVTIRDCVFRGHQLGDTNANVTTECVQVDQSKLGSVSSMSPDDVCDGTTSRNITIDGCRFEPLEVDGVTHPAPNPIGNHTSREGAWYENIRFTNNTIIDPVRDTTSSAANQQYRGNLHFVGNIRRVIVTGNTWRSTTGASVRCIGVYGISRANPADSDPNLQEPTVDGIPTYPENVVIDGNAFEGFTGESASNFTVFVQYIGNRDYHDTGRIRSVTVSGNDWVGRIGTLEDLRLADVDTCRVIGNSFTPAPAAPPMPYAVHLAGTIGRLVLSGNVAGGQFQNLHRPVAGATIVTSGNIV